MSGSGIVELVRSEGAEVPEPSPARPGPIARILLVPVHGYRKWISPVLPPSCRFEPSCSAYAVEALTVHGGFRGCWLTLRRLLRCGPWHPGGWDPVPPRTRKRSNEPRTSDPAHHPAAEE